MKLFLLCLVVSTAALAQDCSFWDRPSTGDSTLRGYQDSTFHVNGAGYHYLDAWHSGYCTYSDPLPGTNQNCVAQIDISNVPAVGDTQTALVNGWRHFIKGVESAAENANQGPVNATSLSGGVVMACIASTCDLSIGLNLGGVVVFTITGGEQLWTFNDNYTSLCPGAVCSFCTLSCTGNDTCPGTDCCFNNFCAPSRYCGGSAKNNMPMVRPTNRPINLDFDFIAMKDRLK